MDVGGKACKVEEGHKGGRPACEVGDRLRLDRVKGKKQGRKQSDTAHPGRRSRQCAGEQQDQEAHAQVDQQVHQVKAEEPEARRPVERITELEQGPDPRPRSDHQPPQDRTAGSDRSTL